MAYVKILTIKSKSHLGRATAYAMNDEKTSETGDISRVINYSTNDDKTLKKQYVYSINCTPDTAAEKMAVTKKQLGKEGGRLGYQIIHSFAPGEVSPELAHQISIEYAEHWLSDYEVVIGTHIDREHIHSHIVCNSVSCVHGRKLHLSKEDFHEKVRGISNELCEEYGLSVIENGREYNSQKNVLRETIIADIEHCITKAHSVADFYIQLENLGYAVDLSGVHVKIRHPDAKKNRRLDTLGYTSAVLKRRILGPLEKQRVFKAYGKQRYERKPLTRFQSMYLHYMYMMGNIKTNSPQSKPSAEDYKKFNQYKAQLKFITDNGISTTADINTLNTRLQARLKLLDIEKFRLRGAMRKFNKLFKAHIDYVRYSALGKDLNKEQQDELDQAVEYMKKQGYAGKYDAIAATRVALTDAKEKNREEILEVKRKLTKVQNFDKDYSNAERKKSQERRYSKTAHDTNYQRD